MWVQTFRHMISVLIGGEYNAKVALTYDWMGRKREPGVGVQSILLAYKREFGESYSYSLVHVCLIHVLLFSNHV